jgi:hypothetical protein
MRHFQLSMALMLCAGMVNVGAARAAIRASPDTAVTPHRERSLNVGERLGYPPPDPPGTVRPPMNEKTVQEAVDQQLKARFDTAADPTTHLLTSKGAQDSGWGFIADHYSQIDRDGDGYVSFMDIQNFMAPRSPLARKNRNPQMIP